MNDEGALHEAVGLGVAGPLEAAGRKIDDEMLTHLVDHGLNVLLLARLPSFLGKPDVFTAALQIDQPGQKACDMIAQERIEWWPQPWIDPPPHHMYEDFEQTIEEPEKHRQSSFMSGGSIESRKFVNARL